MFSGFGWFGVIPPIKDNPILQVLRTRTKKHLVIFDGDRDIENRLCKLSINLNEEKNREI